MSEGRSYAWTVLFADIVGSTAFYVRLGDSRAYALISEALDTMSACTEQHGGRVANRLGDAVLSVFDRPAETLQAADAMHRTLSSLTLQLRIGVHYGWVTLGADGHIYGDPANVTARLSELAVPGETLLSDTVPPQLPIDLHGCLRRIDNRVLTGRDQMTAIYQWVAREIDDAATALVPRAKDAETGPKNHWVLARGNWVVGVPPLPRQIVCGRGDDCDLRVPTAHASRRHAVLSCEDGTVVIQDVSTNGTYLREDNGGERYLHRDAAALTVPATLSLGQTFAAVAPEVILRLDRAESAAVGARTTISTRPPRSLG